MSQARAFSPFAVAFAVAAAFSAGACNGCKTPDDSGVPPVPSSTAPPPSPPATLEIPVVPVASASDGAAGAGGAPKGGVATSSLKACCNALRANAASMPPPNNAYALAAASYCDGAVASGQSNNAILQGVRGLLKGANMPASCK
jgi:hypothetical protein